MTTAARALAAAVAGAAQRFRRQLVDPGAVQREVLARLVARNRGSRFGREHGFDAIGSEAEFAARVPIRSPEQFEAAIAELGAGSAGVLTEEPVVAFEETGGSTAGRRLVPYTASALAGFQAGLHAWLDDLFVAMPGLANGSFYWSISPAGRAPSVTASGLPIGLPGDAAYFGAEAAPHVVASLAVPPAVAACTDMADWRRQTLAHLLAHEDLALISVWSPSFLTGLLAAETSIARDAGEGGAAGLADDIARLAPAGRARAGLVLAELTSPSPDFARIWPRLALISCWDQASARGHAEALRAAFPGVVVQGKGLLATEGLVTIPLHDRPLPVLAPASGYFEFREASGRIRTAETVEDGGAYELILSNGSGLCRYAIGDIVRVRGFAARTPMLEFLGRSAGTDLCGEKLSEAFVLGALAPHRLRFAALAVDSAAMRYRLLVDMAEVGETAAEAIAKQVEQALHGNPQYAHARALRQLLPVTPVRCTEPAARWTALRLQAGQRLGDIKLPALIGDDTVRLRLGT